MLTALAEKYETKEFLIGDPSWFMHQVDGVADKELLAFVASSLSFGSRKQFLPKIQFLLDCAKGDIKGWLTSRAYRQDIPDNDDCYYRLYTNKMMLRFLDALTDMVTEYGSIKEYIRKESKKKDEKNVEGSTKITAIEAVKLITQWFRTHGSKGIVPQDAKSSCKRICMFLRWMVRDNSPVDLGIWSDIIDKRTLIIPMDTHVIQEAYRLHLLDSKTASMATAIKLTAKLKKTFPDDPLKGDFALFGIGVSK